MIVTKRDLLILMALARYFVLDRRHVQEIVLPQDRDGRITRRRLAALTDEGLIRRHATLVASSHDKIPAPIYLLTAKGCQYLAENTGDAQYLYKPVELPHPLHLLHALAIADLHAIFEVAVVVRPGIALESWFNEAEVVNAAEPDPVLHCRLRTKFPGNPEVICSPDAAFVLNCRGRRRAYYLELERGNGQRGTGPRQLAERKCPGYAKLARRQAHRKHFPALGVGDGFQVLLVAADAGRRDAIRRAFQRKDAAQFRTDLWRFTARTEITADTLFDAEICYHCRDASAERLAAPVAQTEYPLGKEEEPC